MLLATYILVLSGLFFLFGGQFIQVAPVLACLAVLLWIHVIRAHGRRVVRSVLFWLWVAFLALVAAQLINPGRTVPLGGGLLGIVLPSRAGLPFTLRPDIAATALASWFALAGLCVASQLPGIRERKQEILSFVLTCAAIMAAIGIAQHFLGSNSKGFYFGVAPYPKPFFSLFGYVNNSATFFMLAAGIALSRKGLTPLLAIPFAVCVALVNCRAMEGALGLLAAFWLLLRVDDSSSIVSVLLIALVALCWRIPELMECRWHEYLVNARLIAQYPAFGCGAHGSIMLSQSAAAGAHVAALLNAQPNTHNDFLVYLVEYGAAGFSLLAAIGALMLRKGVRAVSSSAPVALLAVALALAHGLIDMPLRNFAVLALIVVILIPNLTNMEKTV